MLTNGVHAPGTTNVLTVWWKAVWIASSPVASTFRHGEPAIASGDKQASANEANGEQSLEGETLLDPSKVVGSRIGRGCPSAPKSLSLHHEKNENEVTRQ